MKAAQPYFSVVIPLFNKEDHITNTLYSVLQQTFPDFEILVINDGSTDNSSAILSMFQDFRLRVFNQPNAGVSAARNQGIKRAQGKFIAFLDADDLWEPSYLAEMKILTAQYPACGFYGAAHTVLEDHRSFIEGSTMPEGLVENYFRNEWLHHITRLSATVVNPIVFKAVPGFPVGMISGEDSYFCACIARQFPVAYTPKPLVIYNKKFSGLSQRFDKVDNCRERWIDLYSENDLYQNEYIAGKAIRAGIRYALSLNRIKGKAMEQHFRYTRLSNKKWRILYIINRLPDSGIKLVLRLIFLKNLFLKLYRQIPLKKQKRVLKETPPNPVLVRPLSNTSPA